MFDKLHTLLTRFAQETAYSTRSLLEGLLLSFDAFQDEREFLSKKEQRRRLFRACRIGVIHPDDVSFFRFWTLRAISYLLFPRLQNISGTYEVRTVSLHNQRYKIPINDIYYVLSTSQFNLSIDIYSTVTNRASLSSF